MRVYRKSRHVRWNWEESPDNPGFVRYHIVIVDDKDREGIMNQILEQIQRVRTGINQIRSIEGRVIGSEFRYLFRTYDSSVAPNAINFIVLHKPIKNDKDLRERKRGNIEDYVANLYSIS